MLSELKAISKTPFAVILLLLGGLCVLVACATVDWLDKGLSIRTHEPMPLVLFVFGTILVVAALGSFSLQLYLNHQPTPPPTDALLDASKVRERDGQLSTRIGTCEIRIIFGRLEDSPPPDDESILTLPCNEYFDRHCVLDPKGALGAYAARAFAGRKDDFAALVEQTASNDLGPPQIQQKSTTESAPSFGPGRALLLTNVLNTGQTLALLSTTTQRVSEGLAARISYLFPAINEMVTRLANQPRVNKIVMPLLGAGRGGLEPALALVSLLIAVSEAVRSNPSRLKCVTIIVFQSHPTSDPAVDRALAHRALALIAR